MDLFRTASVTALLAVSCATTAQAEPAVATTTDQLVEVAWNEADKTHTKVALALPPERSCSSVEMERDKQKTRVNICRTSADNEPALLAFEIDHMDTSGPRVRSVKLHASARLKRGARVVIGRFEPADMPGELVATLR